MPYPIWPRDQNLCGALSGAATVSQTGGRRNLEPQPNGATPGPNTKKGPSRTE